MGGIALGYTVGDLDSGDKLIGRALALNPNLAAAWLFSGWTKVWLGDSPAAIERLTRAMRLSPQDPNMFNMQAALAGAHFIASEFETALSLAAAAVENQPNYVLGNCILAASAAYCGRRAEARAAVTRLLQLEPGLTTSEVTRLFPARRSEDRERLIEGLRQAGLSSQQS